MQVDPLTEAKVKATQDMRTILSNLTEKKMQQLNKENDNKVK